MLDFGLSTDGYRVKTPWEMSITDIQILYADILPAKPLVRLNGSLSLSLRVIDSLYIQERKDPQK